MKRLHIAFLFAAVSVCSGPVAEACDLCAVFSATRATGADTWGFNAGVAEQFTRQGTLKDNGQTVPNPDGQHLTSSITQIFSSYTFKNRLGVQLTIPIIARFFKRTTETGVESGSVSGIRDITLMGTYLPYQKHTETFSFTSHLLAGLKLPTGSTSRLKEEAAEGHTHAEGEEHEEIMTGVHGHDLTLGTGSVGGIVGGKAYVRWRRFLSTAEIQYSIRSRRAIDYRFANDLHWSVAPGLYALFRHNMTLAVQARLSGERKGLDDLDGTAAADTGINAVFLGPSLLFTWQDKLSASLGADLPLLIHNTGLQTVPDFRIRSAVTWNF